MLSLDVPEPLVLLPDLVPFLLFIDLVFDFVPLAEPLRLPEFVPWFTPVALPASFVVLPVVELPLLLEIVLLSPVVLPLLVSVVLALPVVPFVVELELELLLLLPVPLPVVLEPEVPVPDVPVLPELFMLLSEDLLFPVRIESLRMLRLPVLPKRGFEVSELNPVLPCPLLIVLPLFVPDEL